MLSSVTAILEMAIIYSAILRCQVLRGASTCCGRDADILVLFHAGSRKILDEMQLYRSQSGRFPDRMGHYQNRSGFSSTVKSRRESPGLHGCQQLHPENQVPCRCVNVG